MNKDLTELVFIIDESGSMNGLEKDTIGGFNAVIEKQKKEKGECLVSTIFFANDQKVVHDRIKLKDVKELGDSDYCPGGCTALIDTVSSSIEHIRSIHRYIREEDRPSKTMFVITTDGMENASRKYTLRQAKEMISQQKEKGWEFLFLAANIDAYETAKEYGFEEDSTVSYINDKRGNDIKFMCVCEAITSIREKGFLDKDWDSPLIRDHEERRNG